MSIDAEPLNESWTSSPRMVPISKVRENQAIGQRIAELASSIGRTTSEDQAPPAANGDVREVESRLVYRRERTCPIAKQPFWALFEVDRPAVYGPWETRIVGEKIFKDREILKSGVPGQRWEESPSQVWKGLTSKLALKAWDPWPWPRDGLVGEAIRFGEAYPLLGAMLMEVLGVEIPAAPVGKFEVGPVTITPTPWTPFKIDCRVFLEKHLAGDLGDSGPLEGDLAEGQEYAPQLYGQGVESRVAWKTGHGLIRSQYPIEGHRGEYLKIATILAPGRAPETAIWTSRDR